jgi:hypothetical protein
MLRTLEASSFDSVGVPDGDVFLPAVAAEVDVVEVARAVACNELLARLK